MLVLLGALVFLRVVSNESAGDQGVRSLLWVSWIVAFVTAILGIGMQAAYSTGQDIAGIWDTTAIADVMDTRFGQSWLVRAGLLVLVLAADRASPESAVRRSWTVPTAVLGLAVLATFTFAQHARTGRWVRSATITDIVHLASRRGVARRHRRAR